MLSEWFVLAVACSVMCLGGYGVRRFVRHNAPFYARFNIVVVGATIGITFALAMFGWVKLMSIDGWERAALSIVTLGAIGAIGFRPDIIDWHKKAGQTAGVAIAAYVVVCLAVYLAV